MSERENKRESEREDERKAVPAADGEYRGADELRKTLRAIDDQPFGQYKQLLGLYRVGEFELSIDRVPPDPFAGSARLRLMVSRDTCGLPTDLAGSRERRIGIEDMLGEEAAEALRVQPERKGRGGPGSGSIHLVPGGPAVLERSACRITDQRVELRLFVDLPAWNRRIRGRQAETLIFQQLTRLAQSTLLFSPRKNERARKAAENVEDHTALRDQLAARGLVAFVADGSLLARAGGEDQGPRRDGQEVAFRSPDELRVTLTLPHAGDVSGMGIPAGVTLIVGGGFHGKSTLLDALARGVHPHRPEDGRERVASVPDTVVIRAEDGRAVRGADISGFLGDLPSGALASDFTTEKASGSTSQASSIVEALEVGARLLLLDEDRCATNFMIRDGRMQRLVPPPAEPIVPFLDRVRELYDKFGVSTVLVTGGSGDYLEVADTVIQMQAYEPRDVTARARQIAEQTRSMRLVEERRPFEAPASRVPRPGPGLRADTLRTGSRGTRVLRLGEETLDLSVLEQIVETGQVRALGPLMKRAAFRMKQEIPLARLVDELDRWLDEAGIDGLDRPAAYDLSRPRRFELAAALNRWRALRFDKARPPGGDSGR